MHPVVHSLGLAVVCAAVASGPARAELAVGRASYAAILREEAMRAGLPFDIGDAVMAIESGYDPTKIGGVGEIGLLQVRPTTAAMLGFRGSPADLARPEVNIHYGVVYLAEAWRQAGGDLCRALTKYRAGHGTEVMTPLSVTYCERARAHLAAVGSVFANGAAPVAIGNHAPGARAGAVARGRNPLIGMSSTLFWARHTTRIARINAQIERRWRRMASR